MLNKNQSQKRNSWKYAVIIPALIGFVLLFQIKVIAQEKEAVVKEEKIAKAELIAISIDKNSSDEEMKKDAELMFSTNGIVINYSKIKRNSNGEIIAIQIDYKDKNGNKGKSQTNGDEPIDTITIFKSKNSVGIRSGSDNEGTAITDIFIENSKDDYENLNIEYVNIENDEDFPTPPITPIAPTAPEIIINSIKVPSFPNAPKAPTGSPITNEKEWRKFEKQMVEFEKKMEAMRPEMDAYAIEISTIEEQMKPFEAEMKKFEEKMKVFDEQMKVYQTKLDIYLKKTEKKK